MPGYVIHLAVANEFLKRNRDYDKEKFIEGVIAPDLLKAQFGKEKTHYGVDGKSTSPQNFLASHKLDKGYNSGYYLHLITDKEFYNNYFTEWSPKMYDDYDILNNSLIKKYNIHLPEKIKDKVFSTEGKLTFLNWDKINKFIDDVAIINLEKYK